MQTTSIRIRRLFLVFVYLAWTAGGADAAGASSNPGCPTKCGDLTVPYPFGIGANSGCSLNPFFAIDCDASFNPPKAFLTVDSLEVLGISEATISVRNRLAVECYDPIGDPTKEIAFSMNLSSTPYTLSSENMLTVVGCDDAAFLSRDAGDGDVDDWSDLISSCVAICSKLGDLSNGFCSGIGCCQSSIPKGLQSTYVYMKTGSNRHKVQTFSSCGYSFLADKSSYSFNISDVSDSSFATRIIDTVPVVIDWAIGDQTCDQIRNTTEEIICQQNSVCVDSGTTLGGYRCTCSSGYHGNPYLSSGCQDINECESKPCHQDATCKNLRGSFNCYCPLHYIGDGTKHGTGCLFVSPPRKAVVQPLFGIGFFCIRESF